MSSSSNCCVSTTARNVLADSISVKFYCLDEIRRSHLQISDIHGYDRVIMAVQTKFPGVQRPVIRFQDEDGDFCMISSSQELAEAVTIMRTLQWPTLKLYVTEDSAEQKQVPEPSGPVQNMLPQNVAQPGGSQFFGNPSFRRGRRGRGRGRGRGPSTNTPLVIDFLLDEKVRAALSEAVTIFVRNLSEVKDQESAQQLVTTILAGCPALARHQLVQHLVPVRSRLLKRLVKLAVKYGDEMNSALPALLNVLPQLLQTLPSVLINSLEASGDAQECSESDKRTEQARWSTGQIALVEHIGIALGPILPYLSGKILRVLKKMKNKERRFHGRRQHGRCGHRANYGHGKRSYGRCGRNKRHRGRYFGNYQRPKDVGCLVTVI